MERFKHILIFIIVCAFLVFCFTIQGCRTIEYVPIHTTDTLVVNNYIRDSIHSSDSVYVYRNSDTLYVYREKVLWRDRAVHDTVISIKEKEVPVAVEKVVEVEKKLGIVDRILILFGLIFLILIILKIIKIFKK